MADPKSVASNQLSAPDLLSPLPDSGQIRFSGNPASVFPGRGANDGPVDDFLELVDGWEKLTGRPLIESDVQPVADDRPLSSVRQPTLILDQIACDFSPEQMRQLGESLMRLADSIDQKWTPQNVRATYHRLTTAGRIERNALSLAQVAMRLRRQSMLRIKHIPREFLGEPCWQMLLELFIQFAGGAKVSTKSLCISSGVPDTTALRMMEHLETAHLIERSASPIDRRVTLVTLTRQGVIAVGRALTEADR
jgi:hypothetical protein